MIWMMLMFSRFRYIFFAVALLSGPVCAGARVDLSAFTRGLKTLQGHFSQEVIDTQGRVKERSNGTVALSLPNLLRWECDAPYKQLVVADGKRVWLFDPDLNQASVLLQDNEERNSPLIALIDPIQLDRKYDVSEEVAMRDGLRWLSLRPRGYRGQLPECFVWFFSDSVGENGACRQSWAAYSDCVQWLAA